MLDVVEAYVGCDIGLCWMWQRLMLDVVEAYVGCGRGYVGCDIGLCWMW